MTKIERFLSKEHYERFKTDINGGVNSLVQKIKKAGGELDLQFRPGNKFNIYFKGISLTDVQVQKSTYKIRIHEKFDPIGSAKKDHKKRFPPERFLKNDGNYLSIFVKRTELLAFFQNKIIDALSSNIKRINYGEEITFEQSLVTDNLDNENIIIIDRQIVGCGLPGRLNLLGLQKTYRGSYRLVVLEAKLGINPDLKGEVVHQIETYIGTINNNVENFQSCYKKNYRQKKEIGLFPDHFPGSIEIEEIVEGRIVVGLYSKIGRNSIDELSRKYPQWKLGTNVIQFKNELA